MNQYFSPDFIPTIIASVIAWFTLLQTAAGMLIAQKARVIRGL